MKTLSITALTAAFLPSLLVAPMQDPRALFGIETRPAKVTPLAPTPPLEPMPSATTALAPQQAPPLAANTADAPALKATESVDEELRCLALNIYHEARSEPLSGQIAVARVTLNRVESTRFPSSVCGVVKQGGQKRNRCQFSWWCDGKSDQPTEPKAWRKSLEISKRVLANQAPDPTAGALYYHANYVKPSWSRSFQRTAQIGRHLFYRPGQS
ncbi:cell wall hydrolase [Halochromatium glycolicum]|uniref:Cell wall hydrolase n=1 Tax=Halochromatium glycolicum TaxID=85075 RepID=A0AAJ0U7W0_9GAMM|nr:cell wall hydrolase [Halochromatium glycolicum]MBK1706435.1 cell wall hydrolase [Halochromatium glycolicum]